MADWTWSTQPSPSVAFLIMTSNSRAFLHARTLAPSSFAPSKILTSLASRSSRMKAGVARNLPAATMVSQHLAANSADVHFSSQAFSTTGASLVVLTILISGFLGASSMVASADGLCGVGDGGVRGLCVVVVTTAARRRVSLASAGARPSVGSNASHCFALPELSAHEGRAVCGRC